VATIAGALTFGGVGGITGQIINYTNKTIDFLRNPDLTNILTETVTNLKDKVINSPPAQFIKLKVDSLTNYVGNLKGRVLNS
jgi:hypothetical protein